MFRAQACTMTRIIGQWMGGIGGNGQAEGHEDTCANKELHRAEARERRLWRGRGESTTQRKMGP